MDLIKFALFFWGINSIALVIAIILAVLAFFLCRWIFGRAIATGRRRVLTLVIMVFTMILFYAGSALIWPLKPSFDKTGWDLNKEKRYLYYDYIVESKMLIGKTKAEVRTLLGKEEQHELDSNRWSYYLGFRPRYVVANTLGIEFKNGKVTKIFEGIIVE